MRRVAPGSAGVTILACGASPPTKGPMTQLTLTLAQYWTPAPGRSGAYIARGFTLPVLAEDDAAEEPRARKPVRVPAPASAVAPAVEAPAAEPLPVAFCPLTGDRWYAEPATGADAPVAAVDLGKLPDPAAATVAEIVEAPLMPELAQTEAPAPATEAAPDPAAEVRRARRRAPRRAPVKVCPPDRGSGTRYR